METIEKLEENINQDSEIKNDDVESISDLRSYYYFEKNDVKVYVHYKTEDDGTVNKITTKCLVKSFIPNVNEKVKKRSAWSRFGQSENGQKVTTIADDVFFEVNQNLKFFRYKKHQPEKEMKQELKEELKQEMKHELEQELNKKVYCEFDLKSLIQDQSDVNQNTNTETKPSPHENMEFKTKPKVGVVKCRHCGSDNHWSIKCNLLNDKPVNKNEDNYKSKNRQEDGKYRNRDKDNSSYSKDSNRLPGLQLRDVDPSMDDENIKAHLSKYGTIINYYNAKKNDNSLIFVTFSTQEENDYALEKLKRDAIGYTFPTVQIAKPKKQY